MMTGMNKQQFWLILGLTVAASFLALTIGIALNNVASRERARQTSQIIADATATAVAANIVIINNQAIRLEPDPNRYVTLVDFIPPAGSDGLVIVGGGDEPSTPTPFPTDAAPTPNPEPTRDLRPVIFMQYVVQQGDSLYAIANKTNSSIELMSLHGISDTQLSPGVLIERLPYANPAYCPGLRAYVVRDMDTVYRIAVQFRTTPEIIRDLNNLGADYRVDVTQVVCVPSN
jgi:LysM repeat protein